MVSSKRKKRNIQEITQQDDDTIFEKETGAIKNINTDTIEHPDSQQKKSKKNKKRKHEELENQIDENITIDDTQLSTASDTISKKKRKSKSLALDSISNSNELKDNLENFVESNSNKNKMKKKPSNIQENLVSKMDSNDSKIAVVGSQIKKRKKIKKTASAKDGTDVATTKNLEESQNGVIQDSKNKNRKRKKRKNSDSHTSENENSNPVIPPNKKAKKGNGNTQNRQRKISGELPEEQLKKTPDGSAGKAVQKLNRSSERTVVVENLPIKFMLEYKKTLRKHFEKYGEIVYVGKVELFPNEDKKLKFSTIIVFKELESVQKALEEDNLKFKDARIRVKTMPALVDSTIFVHSRSTLDQAMLSTIFSPSGKISTILEVKHNTAFVQFTDPDAVTRALKAATEAKVSGNSIIASRYKVRPRTDSENEFSLLEHIEKSTTNQGSDAPQDKKQ